LPGLEDLFGVIVTSEDIEPHKPNPEPLLLALRKLETTPAEAAYVGDSPFDVEAAKAAGLRAIAVTWGGIHGEERLLAMGPDALVSTTTELKTALGVSPA
jgi:pyrophosphatase PpaX